MDPAIGRYPFQSRYVMRVTLRQRDTGRLLSVINTHLPQKIEDFDRPGRWTTTGNAIKAQYQLDRMTREWEHAPAAGWSAPATTTSTRGSTPGWGCPAVRGPSSVT